MGPLPCQRIKGVCIKSFLTLSLCLRGFTNGEGMTIFRSKGGRKKKLKSQPFYGGLRWIKSFIAKTWVWTVIFWLVVRPKRKRSSKLGQHALATHGIEGFSKEFYNKAQSGIREGYCDYGDAEEMISEDCSACYEACSDCADECCC